MINANHLKFETQNNKVNSNNNSDSMQNNNGLCDIQNSLINSSASITITKSQKDKHEYKFIVLKNNMRCLLIYDKDADKSAAAMTVNIGSLCDPKEYEGLAHFLEHMLFMGTEKYPDENDFSEFLSKNSGDSNAYTDLDSTQYYFDVKNEKFIDALDKFSNFFKKPLFNKSALEREMKAVESEHVKNIKSDDDRFLEILRSESHPSTPFAKFQTGSLATLKKLYIRKNLKNFYKTHYSSNLMSLCVLSKIPLEELEKIIQTQFEEVTELPTDVHEIRQEFIPESIFPYEQNFNLNCFYKILNIKENSTLSFYWMINENLDVHYKSSPLDYVTNLLGHEGRNSLATSLINDQLISDLEAGYDVIAHTYTQVSISITLTSKGFENYREIMKRVLFYLNKIQTLDINQEFFEEYQRMSYVDFDYFEKDEPVDFCSELSNNVLMYHPQDIISGGYLIEEYDPVLIKKYLNSMNNDCLNVYLCSNKFENEFNSLVGISSSNSHSFNEMEVDEESGKSTKLYIEKHYGTKFTKEKFNFNKFLNKDETTMKHNEFYLPPKNCFIPKNFDLKDFTNSNIPIIPTPIPKVISLSHSNNIGLDRSHSNHPRLISSKENKFKIWYKQDTTFKIPKVFIFSQIYLTRNVFDYSYEDENGILKQTDYQIDFIHYKTYIDLWYDFLHKEMRETIYLASLAKIDFQLYVNNLGLSLELSGFHDSLPMFVKEIMSILKKCSDIRAIENLKEKLLTILESNIKSIKNSFKGSASTQVSLKLANLINDPNPDRRKFLLVLEELKNFLSTEDFYASAPFLKFEYFIKNYFNKSFFEWLIQGNILPEEGLELIDIFHTQFESKEFHLIEMNQIRTVKLSPDINFYHIFESDEEHNSAIISYFQLGYLTEKEACLVEIIEKCLQEKFFDEIRTKQALGYSVYLRHEYNRKISAVCCMVQSNVQSPEYIYEKISEFFIDNCLTEEENFSEEDFKKYVEAIISDLKRKDINLAEEVNRNFEEIMIREYVFNRCEQRIKIYQNDIRKKDVVEFFQEHFLTNVKRLDVELVAKKHKEKNEKFMKKISDEFNEQMQDDSSDKNAARIEIKTNKAFKRVCELYPDYYYYIKLK